MIEATELDNLYDATRGIVEQLLQRIERDAQEINWRDAKIEKLTFEMAQLKRLRFGVKSERLNVDQQHLFEEAVSADLAAIEAELDELKASDTPPTETTNEKFKPKRAALPANLPRVERHHEPESANCACGCELKRIGEDVSEKLAYEPGQFTVERHVRGKWACMHCKTLIQAPVPAEVIDKGIPTSGLLAHVLVAKHADHLPLYRQEAIFGRAALAIPRSTLAAWVGVCGVRLQPLADALKRHVLNCQVVHADETPVAMLAPGKGKTHRAYLWAYAAGVFEQTKAVVYDFQPSRSGEHARNFLVEWRGSLVCDDYGGYKACFAAGVTKVGCMAHARRKFMDLLLALGRSNWLFAGSLRAGQRAAAVMSLIQSARMNGHDPYAYLKDVLTRLPTQQANRIEERLPHRWQATQAGVNLRSNTGETFQF